MGENHKIQKTINTQKPNKSNLKSSVNILMNFIKK